MSCFFMKLVLRPASIDQARKYHQSRRNENGARDGGPESLAHSKNHLREGGPPFA
jgi:hypothetical protein